MANTNVKVTKNSLPYATMTIDREHQVVTVRRHRERGTHLLTLPEVVDMIEARAVKQSMGEAAAALAPRKLRRGR